MTGIHSSALKAMAALGTILVISGTVVAQPQRPLLAFAQLEPGLWQVRELNNSHAPSRSVCIGDPTHLIQLEHREQPCSRLIITNDPQAVTVHYTCPSNGFGRTSMRVQTPRIAKIDTQGIVDNAPFAYRAEARRMGPCRPQGRASR